MGYVYSKKLDVTFEEAVARTRDALAAEGSDHDRRVPSAPHD